MRNESGPASRTIARGAAKDNYKLSSLILGIVNSDAFRKQGSGADPKTTVAKVVAK